MNEVLVSGSETLGRATIGLLDQIEDLQNRIEYLKKENIALKASLAICFFIFVVWHFGSIWHWFTSILLSIWHFGISHYYWFAALLIGVVLCLWLLLWLLNKLYWYIKYKYRWD